MLGLSKKDLTICREIMDRQWYYYLDEEFSYITYPGVKSYKYAVSTYGNIINLKSKRLLCQHENRGYMNVSLSIEEHGNKNFRTHRLVAWEFCPGYDDITGYNIINHIDRNRSNNHYTNLEWCTSSHNNLHTGLNENYYSIQRGISKDDATKICELYSQGYTPPDVFKWYTGSESTMVNESLYTTMKNIYYRKTYKNISCNYSWEVIDFHQKLKSKQYKFNDGTIHDICRLFEEGKSIKEVFEIITGYDKVSKDKSSHVIISNIFNRKTHKQISKDYNW